MAVFEPLPPIPESVWLLLAKSAGAISGSAVSIIYMLPDDRREAAARFVVGIVIGLVFARPVGLNLSHLLGITGELSPIELSMTGAAAASLTAWWALGALARFLRSYQPK